VRMTAFSDFGRRPWWRGIAVMLVMMASGFGIDRLAAQELRIAVSSEPSSFDPHFHNLTPNNQIMRHAFEPLILSDERQALSPGLAASWRLIDDLTWEFKLRPGVIFHDGSAFSADDVIASFERAPNVPRSPSPFTSYVKGRVLEKIDDLTLRIKTATPDPLMLNNIAQVMIISKAAARAPTEDFNSGKAAIGTGPYRFNAFVPGDRVVLDRFDGYWGGKPQWARVTLKPISSNPARVAALLAGDTDVIEAVPTTDAQRLKADKNLVVASALSNRVIYFHLDQYRDVTPFIRAKDGSEIKNPLRDVRVRQALSKAINRPAMVERVMEGEAVPASQLLPDSYHGTSKNLKPVALDVAGARKLLSEAGYPNGFKMVMHGPNGRYTNDTKIIEAAAQMFARIGIEASVETLPPAPFFSRASSGNNGNPEFSFILVGWSAGTGEPSDSLRTLLGTFDREKGTGAANRGRYSNPEFDAILASALRTVDDKKRAALLAEATDMVMNDVGLIPIHYQLNTWAARKGYTLVARSDEYTLATSVKPAP